MRNIIIIFVLLGLFFLGLAFTKPKNLHIASSSEPTLLWQIQSFDTTKYSRDLARDKMHEADFDNEIDTEMNNIALTGATHVAISTPYDEEFVPFMERWVKAARKHNLSVWFRGNWSGWEGWFDYPAITREEHLRLTREFIINHPDLFQDGDLFSACPECENGAPGDPRQNGQLNEHRQFLIDEYRAARQAFVEIKKNVKANYTPMNGDVARLVMDKDTTNQLGGIVVVDHYIADPAQYERDLNEIVVRSGGKIVLGEFGAPIADVHEDFTDAEQAEWIDSVLKNLVDIPEVIGVNYWSAVGGETQIWKPGGEALPAVKVIEKYYKPKQLAGRVTDQLNYPVAGAEVLNGIRTFVTDSEGKFTVNYIDQDELKLTVLADGYRGGEITTPTGVNNLKITLSKDNRGFFFRTRQFINDL